MAAPAEIDGIGQPSGDSYTFNGVTYTAAEVGTVNGTVRWKKTMPYAGLGWGTPASKSGGLTFLFDLGVGIGKPTIGLTASLCRARLDARRRTSKRERAADPGRREQVLEGVSGGGSGVGDSVLGVR